MIVRVRNQQRARNKRNITFASLTSTNLGHRQAAECGVHVGHACEHELRAAVRPGHEAACTAGLAAVHRDRGERGATVDAHTAFVPDPARVARILVEGITVAGPRV